MSAPKLFEPIKVGLCELKHRVVFASTTRFRNSDLYVPLPHVAEYYDQRSKVPGTLIITEAASIAHRAGGYPNIPGIWSEEQIVAWKRITDTVHANGSYIYLQLWAFGRAALPSRLQKQDPPLPWVSASDIPMESDRKGLPRPLPYMSASDIPMGNGLPHPLTIPEIKEYVVLYGVAASNAINNAGFDGVEILSANGYLPDQFLQDVSNKRDDEYGGSVENRTRFVKEVIDEVVRVVGPERTAIRFSPWGTFQGMLMDDPIPTFSHIVSYIRDSHPKLSYIHIVEPRAEQRFDNVVVIPENDFIRKIWTDRPLISAGGYTRAAALSVAEDKGDIIAFSRAFIANPDLPFRLQHDIALNIGDRSTYYVYGSTDPKGYTDYPFSDEFVKSPPLKAT